uniref:Uncharacterized protein n=1 Tax=Arundo donax TaxID=35708 RepID=A0A0A9AAT5_ARUDO
MLTAIGSCPCFGSPVLLLHFLTSGYFPTWYLPPHLHVPTVGSMWHQAIKSDCLVNLKI